MIARILVLLLIYNITIPVFDPNLFLKINCYIKHNPFLIEEEVEEHLVCENFRFSNREVNEFQNRNFVISNAESIIFKNCEIGILNHKFLRKFPKAISIQLDNVKFKMKPSRTANLPIREISIYGGNITFDQNYRVWNNLSELRTFVLGRTSGSYLLNKTIDNDFFLGNKKLESIKIFKEDITSIKDYVFQELHFLQSITLTDLKLKEFPTKLFEKNGLLEFVNLSGNSLGRIPTNYFPIRMKYMTLMDCNITHITTTDFKYKTNLQNLILDNNKIRTFRKGIFEGLLHLRYLSIVGNELNNLTLSDFGNLPELEAINVEWNYLNVSTFLPKDRSSDSINVEYLNQYKKRIN